MTTSIKLCKYNKYVKFINKNNLDIFALFNIGFKLDLVKLSTMIKYLCEYEPFIFAGLKVYYKDKLYGKDVVIIIFSSGKVIIQNSLKNSLDNSLENSAKITINCVNYINKIIFTKYFNYEKKLEKKQKIKIRKIKI